MCKYKPLKVVKRVVSLLIGVILLLGTHSCTDETEVVPDPPYITDKDLSIKQILEKHYANSEFYFGCITNDKFLVEGNPRASIFNKEFSYNTPENQFKQQWVYQQPGATWISKDYEGLIAMARENNQVMRAHGPISPQSSKWAVHDDRTPAELEKLMIEFCTRLYKDLEKNKDVVKWMDVVNETVSARLWSDEKYGYIVGDWFGPMLGTEIWQNPWLIIGQENVTDLKVPVYIEKSFELAKVHAPSIKKLYNHHGRFEPEAWDKVKKTILYLRSKGLEVDALGWQGHVALGFEKDPENMKRLNAIIDWCYYNKIEFHITELDVKLGDVPPSTFKAKEVEIANTYAAVINVFLKKIGKGAVGINLWSFNDRATSEGGGTTAGIYDIYNNPNLTYYMIKETLLKNIPAK